MLTEAELKAGMKQIDINGPHFFFFCLVNRSSAANLVSGDGQLDSSELARKFGQAGLNPSDIRDLVSYLSAIQVTIHAHLMLCPSLVSLLSWLR